MKLSNERYDFLKWLAINVFPSTAALVGVLGVALNVKQAAVAAIVINALGTYLGHLLGVSTKQYNAEKGDLLDE